jgi:pimeloyl-ACP methyl ester carboxylesterase
MFMYGEPNSSLSCLPALAAAGAQLAHMPKSGHFPMYSNPVAMWQRIGEFQAGAGSAEVGVGSW